MKQAHQHWCLLCMCGDFILESSQILPISQSFFFPLIAFFLNKIQKEEHCLTCLLTSIPTPFLTKTQPSHLVSLGSPNLWLQVPFCWITQFRTFNQDSPGSTEMEHLPSVLFLGYHRINWSPAWPVVDPKSFLVAPSASPELSLP